MTVLHPFRTVVDDETAVAVEAIAAGIDSFPATFGSVGRFPGGVVFLCPEPLDRFKAMTAALVAAFPDCPPYGGAFPDPHPHLTVAIRIDDPSADTLDRELAPGLPIVTHVERLTLLVEDDDGRWTVGCSWPFSRT